MMKMNRHHNEFVSHLHLSPHILFILILVIGIWIRLLLILKPVWMNSADLRNYYWAAQQAASGNNPYKLWSQDLSGPRSDLLPLELLFLTLGMHIAQDPVVIRLIFVIIDGVVIGMLFWRYLKSPFQQLLWITLYALSPATLYFFTMTPSDKPIILLFFILILIAQSYECSYCSSILTGLLGAFKWFGLFFAVPIAIENSRRRFTLFWIHMMIIGGLFCLSHILWFPDWRIVYQFRNARFVEPFHTGLAVLLNHLGFPMTKLYRPLMFSSWIMVTWFYWKNWIDLPSAMVLSIISFLLWAPDTTPQMLFLLTLMVLLTVKWDTWKRAFIVWIGTSWTTIMTAAAISGRAGPLILRKLQIISGAYGSIPLVIWSHVTLSVVLYWLVHDQRELYIHKQKKVMPH